MSVVMRAFIIAMCSFVLVAIASPFAFAQSPSALASSSASAAPENAPEVAAPPADDPIIVFNAGNAALAASDPGAAIADFESLADRGVVDANASLDRGLSYALRVRTGHEVPGDLGRAAQSFEEARALSSDPALTADATRALAIIRAEIARRRAREGQPADVETGLTLSKSIVALVSEDAWAIIALVFSLTLTIALFVRSRAREIIRDDASSSNRAALRARTGATIAALSSAPILLASIACALSAREARLHLREAVVVAASVHPTDAHHVVLASAPLIPEGARVVLLDSSAGWSHIHWNSIDAWLPSPAVREIARIE